MAKRKSAALIAAREKARALQAQFDVLAERRLDIATRAVAMRKDLDDFDDETQRLIEQLLAKRDKKRSEKHAQLGALAVEMIDTRVSRSEAAGRLGMTLAELNAARKAFDDAVRARAEASSTPVPPAPASAEPVATPDVGPVPGATSGDGLPDVTLPRQESGTLDEPVTTTIAPPVS
ncbi:hypothetical protein [Streptomyces sp. DH12]|uniref:hypothetical protein n=1 Tax=Streptomyces sp. DH12 TaxID=2857010 RepID=UPI001E4EBE34|nr:hypothetical protein [Streptomyces sp. DH12]